MMSSIVANARYGLIAAAPYPMSRHMWWHSRASPASTTNPTLVRAFSRMRWWCTALVDRSDGIGASSREDPRSDRIRICAPAAISIDARWRISSSAARRPAAPSATGYRHGMIADRKSGVSGCCSHVHELAQLVVVDDRLVEEDLAARGGAGRQQVRLGADRAAERGHELLADRVERRVRDLGEQLREVVEQEPGACREHRDGRVGAHRPGRLGAGLGHRLDDDLDLFGGVAERLLLLQHQRVRRQLVVRDAQVVEVDDALAQPVAVRAPAGEVGLELVVADDPALGRVDQEHPARLQTALEHHVLRGDVEHADLRGHDDQVVAGDHVARGAQAVAVEHRPDDAAVGERDRRGPVPGLHDRRVEPVEVLARRVHLLVALPRLGDHHEHGVRQRVTAHVEQLEHLVERGRVAGAGGADREDPLEVAWQEVALEERLARPHPVAVALHRVDLAVVADVAVRVGQGPRRERVGREARVHQGHRRVHPLVLEVREELRELVGDEHALVDEGARREARDVAAAVDEPADGVLDPLAQHEGATFQVDARRAVALDEDLPERRHRRERLGAERGAVGRDVAPPQHAQALLGDDRVDRRHVGLGDRRVGGEEHQPRRVPPLGRKAEVDHAPEEAARGLDEDAGAVAGVLLGAARPPVVEVAEGLDAGAHDVVAAVALHVHDERDAAGVVLEARVVEALLLGWGCARLADGIPPGSVA